MNLFVGVRYYFLLGLILITIRWGGFARYVFDSVEEQSNCRMLIGPETTRIFNSIASADGRGVYCDWPSRILMTSMTPA